MYSSASLKFYIAKIDKFRSYWVLHETCSIFTHKLSLGVLTM